MLIKELIEQDKQLQEDLKDEDTCGLCATHEAAYRVLEKELVCPFCGSTNTEQLHEMDETNFVAVGDWYADEDEQIRMLPVCKCYNCDEEFILVPQKVMHNYNHDVYYTGRKHVIPKYKVMDLVREITPSIEQYLSRKDVTPDNLAMWVAYDMEEYVSKLLEDNYRSVE